MLQLLQLLYGGELSGREVELVDIDVGYADNSATALGHGFQVYRTVGRGVALTGHVGHFPPVGTAIWGLAVVVAVKEVAIDLLAVAVEDEYIHIVHAALLNHSEGALGGDPHRQCIARPEVELDIHRTALLEMPRLLFVDTGGEQHNGE